MAHRPPTPHPMPAGGTLTASTPPPTAPLHSSTRMCTHVHTRAHNSDMQIRTRSLTRTFSCLRSLTLPFGRFARLGTWWQFWFSRVTPECRIGSLSLGEGIRQFPSPGEGPDRDQQRVWEHSPPSVSTSMCHHPGEVGGPMGPVSLCAPLRALGQGAAGRGGLSRDEPGTRLGSGASGPPCAGRPVPPACRVTHIQALPSAEDGLKGQTWPRCQAPACEDSPQRPPQGGERFALEGDCPGPSQLPAEHGGSRGHSEFSP